MSWAAEFWHQVRRDVWRSRWLLLVYLVMLALAVARATQVTGALSGRVAPVGQVVLLCMPLLVAMTVHADSALRVDAFWAVLPIRASVMVASKLLYIVLLVGLWAVAVGVVMSEWHVRSAVAVAEIGFPDYFAALVLLLLGTAVVTAGCSSLASVGVVLGTAVALSVIVVFSSDGIGWEITARAWWAIAMPLSVGAVVLLARRYRVRTSSRLTRGVTIATGVAVVLFPTLTLDARRPELPASTAPGTSSAVVLRVPLPGQPECAQNRLTLPLEVTSPSTWRVELMRPRLDVSLDDGSHVELAAERWMQAAGLHGPMLPPADAPVVGDSAATRVFRTEIWFELPRGVSTRVCGRVANVALRMQTHVAIPREVLRIPLTSSSPVTVPGHRARIASADVTDSTVAIRMQLSTLTSAADRSGAALGELDFALADPRQARVIRLSAEESNSTFRITVYDRTDRTDAPVDQWGNAGLQWDTNTLPGLTIISRRMQLEAYREDAERARDLLSWGDRAVLLVIAPAWYPYEVRTVRSMVTAAWTSSTTVAPR